MIRGKVWCDFAVGGNARAVGVPVFFPIENGPCLSTLNGVHWFLPAEGGDKVVLLIVLELRHARAKR